MLPYTEVFKNFTVIIVIIFLWLKYNILKTWHFR